jgi:hypothetical protein
MSFWTRGIRLQTARFIASVTDDSDAYESFADYDETTVCSLKNDAM